MTRFYQSPAMLVVGIFLLVVTGIQTSSGADSATVRNSGGGGSAWVDQGSLTNATTPYLVEQTSSNATTLSQHSSGLQLQNSRLTILRFYTVIVVLGISVVAGVLLVVFGLFFKGEAFRKSSDDRMKDNTREGFDRINSDLFLLGLSV